MYNMLGFICLDIRNDFYPVQRTVMNKQAVCGLDIEPSRKATKHHPLASAGVRWMLSPPSVHL